MSDFLGNIDIAFFAIPLAKIVILTLMMILPSVAYSVMIERRLSAVMQDRVGPNRTGLPLTLFGFKKDFHLWGMLQPMADGLKFFLKEDFTPKGVNTFYFWLAPALTFVPAMLTCAVVPFTSELDFSFLGLAHPVKGVIADLNVGPLFTFAIASLGVYGIVLAGWSSNSKYPFLGGVRASSQMISYEMSLGLSIIPVLLICGDLNLSKISAFQDADGWMLLPLWGKGVPWANGWHWADLSFARWVLWVPLFISFVVFVISMFAETNRLPFDMAECETELVAGYHTEYSSMKFALFFMGEYAAMIIGSGMAVTLFLGGWSIPFGPTISYYLGIQMHYIAGHTPLYLGILHVLTFAFKVLLFIMFFVVIRWSIPRFRYDQLMKLGWLYLFEIALFNVLLTAVLMIFFPLH
ncbi:MAG: hypothetical protein JWO94_1580 [Verrucomicrobiaceae bacterium]|nr:hypothetical protein [Verrucomicrobiaceae bacterium]